MSDNAFGGGFPRHSVDTLPVLDATADSIDHDKVALHITQVRARGRYTGPDDPANPPGNRVAAVRASDQAHANLALEETNSFKLPRQLQQNQLR